MIKQDLETATELLEELSHKSVNYQPQIRYLKNKINEERAYQELGKEQKEVYVKAITKGREQYHNNNLSTAYDYYTYGKYITNHPIFDYYIGKILYKNKNKDEAYKCFKNYIENGGEKYLKALLYLVTFSNSDVDKIIFFTIGSELGVRPNINPLHTSILSDHGIFTTI